MTLKRPTPVQALGLVVISPLLVLLAVVLVGATLVYQGFSYLGELTGMDD